MHQPGWPAPVGLCVTCQAEAQPTSGTRKSKQKPGAQAEIEATSRQPWGCTTKSLQKRQIIHSQGKNVGVLRPRGPGHRDLVHLDLGGKSRTKNPGRKRGIKPQRLPLLRIPFCSPQELSSPGPYLSLHTPARTLKVKYTGATHSFNSEDEAGGQGSCPRLVEHPIDKGPQLRAAAMAGRCLCLDTVCSQRQLCDSGILTEERISITFIDDVKTTATTEGGYRM